MNNDEIRFVVSVARLSVIKAGSPLDLSTYIDASEASIYKWMCGTSKPDAVHFLRMLKFLNYLDEK